MISSVCHRGISAPGTNRRETHIHGRIWIARVHRNGGADPVSHGFFAHGVHEKYGVSGSRNPRRSNPNRLIDASVRFGLLMMNITPDVVKNKYIYNKKHKQVCVHLRLFNFANRFVNRRKADWRFLWNFVLDIYLFVCFHLPLSSPRVVIDSPIRLTRTDVRARGGWRIIMLSYGA